MGAPAVHTRTRSAGVSWASPCVTAVDGKMPAGGPRRGSAGILAADLVPEAGFEPTRPCGQGILRGPQHRLRLGMAHRATQTVTGAIVGAGGGSGQGPVAGDQQAIPPPLPGAEARVVGLRGQVLRRPPFRGPQGPEGDRSRCVRTSARGRPRACVDRSLAGHPSGGPKPVGLRCNLERGPRFARFLMAVLGGARRTGWWAARGQRLAAMMVQAMNGTGLARPGGCRGL
jgi:hypothetical protein